MTKITILDGSIGQELIHLAGSKPTPLWSAAVMLDQPNLVRQVHDSYFAVGSTIATTNTYPLLPDRLEKAGLSKQLTTLVNTAIDTAIAARDAHGSGRVAGSIGPLEGSYRPEACPPAHEAAERYKETVALIAPKVDLLLIETMSSVDQAEGALRACSTTNAALLDSTKPVWLAVSVMDEDGTRLRSGEPLTDLAPIVKSYQPQTVLVNCSCPEAISAALKVISAFGKPFGAYANGFTHITDDYKAESATVDALQARQDLTPERYAEYCMTWIEQGATIVGGCCEVGPAHIAEVVSCIRAAGHEIVQHAVNLEQ